MDDSQNAQIASMEADLRDCPFCAEPIKKTAVLCKHCKSRIDTQAPHIANSTYNDSTLFEQAEKLRMSNNLKAEGLYKQCLQERSDRYGNKHPLVAEVLFALGVFNTDVKMNPAVALSFFQQCYEMLDVRTQAELRTICKRNIDNLKTHQSKTKQASRNETQVSTPTQSNTFAGIVLLLILAWLFFSFSSHSTQTAADYKRTFYKGVDEDLAAAASKARAAGDESAAKIYDGARKLNSYETP